MKRLSELNFGNELYALEISSSGVEAIKNKRISRLAECKVFDGYHVPYDEKRFDIAILSHVVEHVEHPRQLIYEASRVARYVFIEVPLEDTFRLPRNFVFDTVGHINFYSPSTIRQLVQSCNLRVLKQITKNPSKGMYIFQKGYKGLINWYIKQALLSSAPIIVARQSLRQGFSLIMGRWSVRIISVERARITPASTPNQKQVIAGLCWWWE